MLLLKHDGSWDDGPFVAGVPPVLVNFFSYEDKTLVWRCLKDGCRGTSVVVTQDSRTRDKGVYKMKKKRKKSNFHAKCHHPLDSDNIDDSCEATEEDTDDTKEKDDVVW